MTKRIYNFSAGPAALPVEVLEIAQKDMLNYGNSGMSVMELSHRSKTYETIIHDAEADLRKLMNIPDAYAVLFMQGGATAQFSAVPLNLMNGYRRAAYVNTGEWSKQAIAEAKRYGQVETIASSEDKNFTYIPDMASIRINAGVDYFHITSNNTIFGTKYTELPKIGILPIVSDMSSFILSEVFDINSYGLVYAGSQKNIGPAGMAIVIVRKQLINIPMAITPVLYNYKTAMENGSMYNTPPTWAIYIAGLVFKWLLNNGGIAEMEKQNRKKANLLYDYIDNSGFYKSPVVIKYRSLMNIPFTLPSEDLDAQFLKEAVAAGLENLKGHRSVGGMRASIYNAMPLEGVQALVDFMANFAKINKK